MTAANSAAYASMIYGIGGALTSGIGAYYQSEAQRNALRMQASVDRLNSQIGELQAQEILYGGNRDAVRVRTGGMKARSKATAQMAASGVDIRGGSALSILEEADLLSEDDAAEVKSRAARAAAGARVRAIQGGANAAIAEAGAGSFSPGLSALSAFGAQGAQVAQRWYQYRAKQEG